MRTILPNINGNENMFIDLIQVIKNMCSKCDDLEEILLQLCLTHRHR